MLRLSSLSCRGHKVVSRASKREFLLSTLAVFPVTLPDLFKELPPEVGNCPSCIGVVDGTLGSCAGINTCLSSYDDRPGHFVAPWQYDENSQAEAVKRLQQAITTAGGSIQQLEDNYIYATFTNGGATDDVEFLFAPNDNTVQLRTASRLRSIPDAGRNERRLETLRKSLGWEPVPILRNRKRALIVVESPWDTFGPVPPPGAAGYDFVEGSFDGD